MEQLHSGDPEQYGHERAGDDGCEAPEREDDRERERADEQRRALRIAEMDDDVPQLLEEVARALLDAEQLGDLTDDDRQRQPDDEALDDGLGDEAREEPQTQEAGQERGEAGRDRQRSGGRHRADYELARAT